MICRMCFKTRDTLTEMEVDGHKLEAKVCKGCYYEITKITGWLSLHGVSQHLDSKNDISGTPPDPPKNKKATKGSPTD